MGNGMQTKVQSKNIDRYSVREMGSVYYQKYREENNGTIGCDMVWRRADVKFFLSEYVIDMNGKIIYYEITSQEIQYWIQIIDLLMDTNGVLTMSY